MSGKHHFSEYFLLISGFAVFLFVLFSLLLSVSCKWFQGRLSKLRLLHFSLSPTCYKTIQQGLYRRHNCEQQIKKKFYEAEKSKQNFTRKLSRHCKHVEITINLKQASFKGGSEADLKTNFYHSVFITA